MLVRRLAATLAASTLALAGSTLALAAPAAAHDGDSTASDPRLSPARVASLADRDASLPLLKSGNVHHRSNEPGSLGVSGCFSKTAPYFYLSGLDSISVFDTSDPLDPTLVGKLDNVVFENEAMNCGERRGPRGAVERFVLVGNNLYDYSSSDPEGSAGSTLADEVIVVDVTDPTKPRIRSRLTTATGDHTVACIRETSCDYAYSSGGRGGFSIIDLRDLDHPVELDSNTDTTAIDPFTTAVRGHKWNFAGEYGVHTGRNGTAIVDVSDPTQPVRITDTVNDGKGLGDKTGYNDFIHHNSAWPNAEKFVENADPSLENGNVLLITEEDYEDVNCSTAGSFQAWHIRTLDGTDDAIVPLDKVELADLGGYPLPAGGFCSAHWFDYHPSGIATIGYYGGGTQFVDTTDPTDLTSYGHAVWGASEVWDSYWVPVYNKNGTATGKRTNIAYSVDLVRGLDVYAVDLPKQEAAGSSELPLSLASSPSVDNAVSRDALLLTGGGLLLLMLPLLRLSHAARTRRHG
jgi:hypothetical protein